MTLITRLTHTFNVRHPVMSAPMSMHSGASLAAAVTNGGGIGMFGAIGKSDELSGVDWLGSELDKAKTLLDDKPFGIGFITHLLAAMPELFELAIEKKVPVMAFSFADPGDYIERAKSAGSITLCQIRNMDQAKEAVAAGSDMLVAQGNEAGGHTGETNLLPLLQRVMDRYPNIPVLAAGGIGSGRNLAAVLAAGTDGAWIGTPLLATPECEHVSDTYKQRLITASADDTLYTALFDIANHEAFGGIPWPEGIAARVIRNQFVDQWLPKIDQVNSTNETLMAEYRDDVAAGNLDKTVVYAGESVDAIKAIKPAAQVIMEICEDAYARLGNP